MSRKIYPPGRYFIGLAHWFILIKKTYITIDLSNDPGGLGIIDTRTKDGLELSVEVSFQYRLEEDKLWDVFDKFAENYHDIVVAIARGSIRDSASQYNAIQFFEGTRNF